MRDHYGLYARAQKYRMKCSRPLGCVVQGLIKAAIMTIIVETKLLILSLFC